MNADTWEVARNKKFVQLNGTGDRLDKDDDLRLW
jgi:hypothetical protein